jgi:energy-coupling factor transporter transmembrane protein EcfT
VLRARRTSIAMISRGFNGAFPVTHIFRWKFYDTAFLALCVIASLAIICVNYI